MSISIITVAYNNEETLPFLFQSLWHQEITDKKFLREILIVDNNSQDKTLSICAKYMKQSNAPFKVRCLHNAINLGFARGVNKAITKTIKSNDILLVNPDIILQKRALELLHYHLEHYPTIQIAGALLSRKSSLLKSTHLFPDQLKELHGTYVRKPNIGTAIFDFTNIKKIWPNNIFSRKFYYTDVLATFPQTRHHIPVDAVSGAFMFIRKSVFDHIKFDNRFFLYLEDVDFCIRAKRYGYQTYLLPYIAGFHKAGSSSPNQYRINYNAWCKSRDLLFKKHFKYTYICLHIMFILDMWLTQIKHKLFG